MSTTTKIRVSFYICDSLCFCLVCIFDGACHSKGLTTYLSLSVACLGIEIRHCEMKSVNRFLAPLQQKKKEFVANMKILIKRYTNVYSAAKTLAVLNYK